MDLNLSAHSLDVTTSSHTLSRKAKIKDSLYRKDLENWLQRRSSSYANHMKEERDDQNTYNRLMNSLRTEKKPENLAVLLIGLRDYNQPVSEASSSLVSSSVLNPKSSEIDVDDFRLGKLIKRELKHEIQHDPLKSSLPPSLVLTEKRRKDLIHKLTHMVSVVEHPDDSLAQLLQEMDQESKASASGSEISQESFLIVPSTGPRKAYSEFFQSPDSLKCTLDTRSIDRLNHNTKGKPSHKKQALLAELRGRNAIEHSGLVTGQGDYEPKWENYDVMKSRWSYIQPQTKRLIREKHQHAPVNSWGNSFYIQDEGLSASGSALVSGSYTDLEFFQKQRAMNRKG